MAEYRNAKYDAIGTITCEINHPVFGWIPFTADPNDVEEHGRLIYAHLVQQNNIAPFLEPSS